MEQVIIQEIQQGNVNRFDVLLQQYQPVIRSICRHYYLPGGEYEDLLQEARIGLYLAAKHYNPEKNPSFEAFACMVVKRKVLSAVRQSCRKKHETLNQSLSLCAPVFENRLYIDSLEDRTYQDLITNIEQPFSLESYLSQFPLTKLEREVLINYLEGRSYSEMISIIGRDYKSIDNALQRIRRKIKDYYQRERITN